MDTKEHLEVVDERGKVSGYAPRSVVHGNPSLIHIETNAFNIFGNAFIETFIEKGQIHKTIFIDDFERVYPDGIVFDMLGNQFQPQEFDINNFLSHNKFYKFAAQFVRNKDVAD